jgi:CRP-like cAMP-binding protein
MMSSDEFVAEYTRRVQESVVALLRERADLALHELPGVLAEVPELRLVKLAELFAPPTATPSRPAPAPPSAAARIAAYLLDLATTAGTREAGGLWVRVPSDAKIGERAAATRESVALTLAILARRNIITAHSQRIEVHDLRGLALIAGRTARHRRGHT